MKDLWYKEKCLVKKQIKQSFISVMLVIALNVYFMYLDVPVSYLTFNLPVVACLILAAQFVNSSVLSEKKNRTYEKMLSVYSIEEMIFAKISFVGIIMSIVGVAYNILSKIVMQYIFKYKVEYSNIFIEIAIQLMIVWLASSTFAILYVICNNQGLLSFISMFMSIAISSVSIKLQAGNIGIWDVSIGMLITIIVILCEIKILKKINLDFIAKQ